MKLKNHVVTRGYLTRWAATDQKGSPGIWYFDIKSREIRFSKGRKASFAIEKGIYAPYYAGGLRDDRLENWFAESETHLCDFLREWSRGKPQKPNVKRLREAIIGCVSLGYRSEHNLDNARQAIQISNPGMGDDLATVQALNNCYASIMHAVDIFTRGFLLIVHSLPVEISTNDQPFVDFTPSSPEFPFATFPAGPRTFMMFMPNQNRPGSDFQIGWYDGSRAEKYAEFAYTAAMHTARRWVVCPNFEEAQKVKSYLTQNKIDDLAKTDRLLAFATEEIRRIFPT